MSLPGSRDSSTPENRLRPHLPLALSLLRVLLALLVGGCAIGCAVAAAVILEDPASADGGDMWAGLLAGIAALALFVMVPVMVATSALWWLIGRSPAAGAKLALALGGGFSLLSILMAPALGTTTAGFLLVAGLPIAALGAVGLAQLAGATD